MLPNYVYNIDFMTDGVFRLRDPADGTVFEISHEQVMLHFSLPYANTVHASQGDKIAEPYLISDLMADELVTKNWLYSALTRCTKLSDIHFLDLNLYHINVNNTQQLMVRGYKHQDQKAGRPFNDADFVDAAWITKQYQAARGLCKYCLSHMTYEKHASHRVSVNRINNSLPHHSANCEVCCLQCNKSLK
jgi:hypothetical protein